MNAKAAVVVDDRPIVVTFVRQQARLSSELACSDVLVVCLFEQNDVNTEEGAA